MTDNTRFQPGDKVRVSRASTWVGVSLGPINPHVTYTVAHVDDFGQVSLQGISTYFHPSHFELVMRAVADEMYCLLDGEGDWWILDEAPDAVPVWRMVSEADVLRDVEDGVEGIARDYGIDAEPTAPAETYCLRDREGDWWFSEDGETFLWACKCCPDGSIPTTLDQFNTLDSFGGIDTGKAADSDTEDDGGEYETEMALAYEEPEPTFTVGDRVEYIGGGEVETARLLGEFGTVAEVGNPLDDDAIVVDWDENLDPWCVLADNLRKADPAPLQPGDWVKALARVEHVYESNGSVRAQTFQSDGTTNGTPIYAIASAITRTDEVPEWAREPERPEEPTADYAIVRDGFRTYLRVPADQIPGFAYGKPWVLVGTTARYTWADIESPVVVKETER